MAGVAADVLTSHLEMQHASWPGQLRGLNFRHAPRGAFSRCQLQHKCKCEYTALHSHVAEC